MDSSPEASPIPRRETVVLSDSDSDSEQPQIRQSLSPRKQPVASGSQSTLLSKFKQSSGPLAPRPNGRIDTPIAFTSVQSKPGTSSANSSAKSFKSSNSFASTQAAFSNGSSAKQRAFQNMEAERVKLGVVAIAVPKEGRILSPTGDELIAKAARLALKGPQQEEEELLPPGSDAYISEGDANKALRELIEATCDMEGVNMEDASLKGMGGVTLMPHQIQGLFWLKDRESGKKHGGILADDQGLGKTVMMIGLIVEHKKAKRHSGCCKTTLIVCPLSLMDQWAAEIKSKTEDGLTVCLHHGPSRSKDPTKLERYDIVIVSYNTLVSEWLDPKPKKVKELKPGEVVKRAAKVKDQSGPLFEMNFNRIILDEAHTIKDRTTKMHKACCDLEGWNRWVLSGTPIQNSIADLHSLFEFLGPIVRPMHEFPEFKAKIMDPIKKGKGKVAMARLAIILKAVMLRRKKTTVIDGNPIINLPGREVILVSVPFHDADERAFYDAVNAKMQVTLNSFLESGTLNNNYTNILILLLRLRQATSHPSLITAKVALDLESLDLKPIAQVQDANKLEEVEQEVDELEELTGTLKKLEVKSEKVKCVLCDSIAEEGDTYCEDCAESMEKFEGMKFSTKIRETIRILTEIKKEKATRKTIVFSQFTSMFDLLEPFLQKAEIKFVRFDGKMNKLQKAQALEKIRTRKSYTVILISIKCGSVGLNLTACSRVILLDLWWNPAIEQQAFDRAHRIGQTEDVKIYKLTIVDTIEDRLLKLQDTKSVMSAAALDGGELVSTKLSTAEIMYLFRG